MIIALAPLILYTLSAALPETKENVTEISKWRHRQRLSQVFHKSLKRSSALHLITMPIDRLMIVSLSLSLDQYALSFSPCCCCHLAHSFGKDERNLYWFL